MKKWRVRKSSPLRSINLTLWLLYILVAALFVGTVYTYNLINVRGFNHILAAGSLFFALVTGYWIKKRTLKRLTTVLLVVGLVVSSLGMFGVRKVLDLSSRLQSSTAHSQYEMSVVVPVDSPITDIREVKTLLAPNAYDQDNITALLSDIATMKAIQLTPQASASYLSAYQELLANQADAMVLNGVFTGILENEDPEFSKKVRTIYRLTINQEAETVSDQAGGESFHLYISGIDTYGPISSVSRSDVNILMTVNRKTHKILLTTTPRDAYLPIAEGGRNQYDKLTHAGLYGVSASEKTLENLYGIDISNYIRLNFTSFLQLIDLVGGIEVDNSQEFTSLHGNYHFPVGTVQLTAEKALGFVRERYSLADGDHDRGKNQEKVIAALIKKLSTKEALLNYTSILKGIEGSVQTNMTTDTMIQLVNDQLADNRPYEVISQALTGTGRMDLPSYSMPGSQLYMMEVDPASLSQVTAAIQSVVRGE